LFADLPSCFLFFFQIRYSVSAQIICDSDKRIIGIHAGCPRSCADSTVFKRMDVYKDPQSHFSPGQYLVADSAYSLTTTCVPSYKAPWTNLQENRDFNHCVAIARVKNEHTIGILKSRWGSLREMRQQMRNTSDMRVFLGWVTSCCILHNMLARIGDSWDDMHLADEIPMEIHGGLATETRSKAFRETLKMTTLEICKRKGLID